MRRSFFLVILFSISVISAKIAAQGGGRSVQRHAPSRLASPMHAISSHRANPQNPSGSPALGLPPPHGHLHSRWSAGLPPPHSGTHYQAPPQPHTQVARPGALRHGTVNRGTAGLSAGHLGAQLIGRGPPSPSAGDGGGGFSSPVQGDPLSGPPWAASVLPARRAAGANMSKVEDLLRAQPTRLPAQLAKGVTTVDGMDSGNIHNPGGLNRELGQPGGMYGDPGLPGRPTEDTKPSRGRDYKDEVRPRFPEDPGLPGLPPQ